MNAQCAVFAESEVVSLIHAKIPKEDIARAVHDAIADRIVSMARRIGIEKDVVVVGGLAKNTGFVDSITRTLSTEVLIPEYPEYVAALGAALHAAAPTGGQ
jgi:benzoyl-CoA reductase subunit D